MSAHDSTSQREQAGAAERAKLIARAAMVGAGTLASRVLGLGRDMALAALFSPEETDAFFVAFTIPNALRQLLAEGAVSSAVVPVLTLAMAEGEDQARRFFQRARGASLLALAVVTVLGVVFAEPLCDLFAAGYHARPHEFARTVALTRVVFPYIFFMGTASLGMAALHAHRRFAVASFAPGLLNVGLLLAAFTFPPILRAYGIERVHALAAGALLGGALQVVAQWPALRAIGYAAAPRFDFRDPRVRTMMRRLAPMTLGIGVYYVDLTLSRRFLSELGVGAQSSFTWASRVCDFPQGIFVMALSTAALPSLSSLAARGDRAEVARTYAHGLRLALFVALPASAACVLLSEPLVAMLFQRGEFTSAATYATSRALVWQGGAIWTVAAVRQLVAVHYALGDTRTPVIVSALDLLVFIGLALGLRGPLGAVGISVAVAGSSAAQMALLFVGLRLRLGTVCARDVGVSALRTLTASLGAGLLARGAWHLALPHFGSARVLLGLLAASVFATTFAGLGTLLRSPEGAELAAALRRRLGARRRRS